MCDKHFEKRVCCVTVSVTSMEMARIRKQIPTNEVVSRPAGSYNRGGSFEFEWGDVTST